MDFDIITLFPRMFEGLVSESIVRIAIEKGLARVRIVDLRNYAHDRRRTVDDKPYGGGPGMVLKPEPIVEAVEDSLRRGASTGARPRIVLFAAQGKRLTQEVVKSLAASEWLILLSGRYEGVDDRVRQILPVEEVSLGDFVLSGGEVASMAVLDATVRLVPGVLGNSRSLDEESFSGPDMIFEYPHYTRPPEFRGLSVPEVLRSGDHGKIRRWREEQAKRRGPSFCRDGGESRTESDERSSPCDERESEAEAHSRPAAVEEPG